MFEFLKKKAESATFLDAIEPTAESEEKAAGIARTREMHLREIYGDKAAQVRAARRAAQARNKQSGN